MTFDESMVVLGYLNRRCRWWRWTTATPWSWLKVEAYYCRLVGEETRKA